ncbi:MAG: YihY/virulence factor BrkB family protein [Ignavibacteria bacterium]
MNSYFSGLNENKFVERITYYSKKLLDKFDNDHVWIMSSGISFNILICLLPFSLMLLTILGVYLDSETVQIKLIEYINSIVPLPGQYKERIIFELIDKTRELTNNTFLTGIIGTAGIFWTASGVFSAMREVLKKIFKINSEQSFIKEKIRDFFLVIISLILLILSVAATSIVPIVETYSQGLFGETIILNFFQKLVPVIGGYLLSFCLFYIMYIFIPYWKMNKKVIFFTSVYTAIFFELLKYLFGFYILKVANYSRIYGAFATIVISIFFIYYVSLIFVVGAEFGEIYKERNKLSSPVKSK